MDYQNQLFTKFGPYYIKISLNSSVTMTILIDTIQVLNIEKELW